MNPFEYLGKSNSIEIITDMQDGFLPVGNCFSSETYTVGRDKIIQNIKTRVQEAVSRGDGILWIYTTKSGEIVDDLQTFGSYPRTAIVYKDNDGFRENSEFYRKQIDQLIPSLRNFSNIQRGIQTSWCVEDCAEYLVDNGINLSIPVGTTANLNLRKLQHEKRLIQNNDIAYVEETFLPHIFARIDFEGQERKNLLEYL